MISILAGITLIKGLFALSTLEGIFQRSNFRRPVTLDCKKYIFAWVSFIYALLSLIFLSKFLYQLFGYLDEKKIEKDLYVFTLQVAVLQAIGFLLVVGFKEQLWITIEDMFSENEDFYDDCNYSYYEDYETESETLRKNRLPLKKMQLKEIPGFIKKFSATYFKMSSKKKPRLRLGKKKIKKAPINQSFCIDVRNNQKYFAPKMNSQSFYMNRSINQSALENPNVSQISAESEIPPEPLNPSESYVLCNVCFCQESDSVFMDCGHGGVCLNCASDIWNSTGECYLCRNTIDHVLRYDINDKKGAMFKVIELHKGSEQINKLQL